MIKVDSVSKLTNIFVKSKSQTAANLDLPAKVALATASGLVADTFVAKCSDFDDIVCNISYA